jgi:hypothetical protein
VFKFQEVGLTVTQTCNKNVISYLKLHAWLEIKHEEVFNISVWRLIRNLAK